MVDMFSEGRLGPLALKNRLVRSAVWEGLAEEDGSVTDGLVSYIREIAAGGVGLIILGYTFVEYTGRQSPGQTGLYSDKQISGMKALTDAAHEAGAKISIQLVHAGLQTSREMTGLEKPVGPSAVAHPLFMTPRELSTEDVKEMVEAFGSAAGRAVDSGFDAIQIHGAHGYLVSQFMSPRWNRREDEYGGSLENRMRFAVEVYAKVREHAGDLPVHIKLNLDDQIEGSTTPEEALPLAEKLSGMGIDAIEVSAGGPASKRGPSRTRIKKEEDEGYFMDLARQTRKQTSCTIIGMGGFRSPKVINSALSSGDVDLVSMARPLIREPGLVNRWLSGDLSKAKCISCNGCFKTLEFGNGIRCHVELKAKEKNGR